MTAAAISAPPFSAVESADLRAELIALRRALLDDAASAVGSAMIDQTAAAGRTAAAQPSEVSLAELRDVAAHLRDADGAIARIDGGGDVPFGICAGTGEAIEPERLRLMPWTPVSLAGARAREAGSGFRGRA
jgi:RNA polymerase-binding transcription factor DksA